MSISLITATEERRPNRSDASWFRQSAATWLSSITEVSTYNSQDVTVGRCVLNGRKVGIRRMTNLPWHCACAQSPLSTRIFFFSKNTGLPTSEPANALTKHSFLWPTGLTSGYRRTDRNRADLGNPKTFSVDPLHYASHHWDSIFHFSIQLIVQLV
jgi:hypothetical protein